MIETIDLLGTHGVRPDCRDFAQSEYETLHKPRYEHGVSIRVILPMYMAEPFAAHRTARKRAQRASLVGYSVRTFEPCDRHEDMLHINRSAPERQGRPMDDSYVNLVRTESKIGDPACCLHHVLMYGVFAKFTDRLVAYATIYRCGELVHVSQLLGHADRLNEGIMYLLLREVIGVNAMAPGKSVLFYNRHDSGGDGLRFFKERIGLEEGEVKWTLGT